MAGGQVAGAAARWGMHFSFARRENAGLSMQGADISRTILEVSWVDLGRLMRLRSESRVRLPHAVVIYRGRGGWWVTSHWASWLRVRLCIA